MVSKFQPTQNGTWPLIHQAIKFHSQIYGTKSIREPGFFFLFALPSFANGYYPQGHNMDAKVTTIMSTFKARRKMSKEKWVDISHS